ncbi:MAG: ArsR/SmtB family transcription factor [Candidatus Thorarchaeota archaeon]
MSEIKELTSEFLKVLVEPTRLEILKLLRNNEISQVDIQNELGMAQSTISQHLKVLMSNNLIISEKKENRVKIYKIKYPEIYELLSNINSFVVKINKEKFVDVRDLDVIDTLF